MARNPFAKKRLRTVEFRFEVEDSAAAKTALDEAKSRAFLAKFNKGQDADSLQQQADAAQKAYNDCFEIVRFRQNTSAVELLEQKRTDAGDKDRPDDYQWWADPESYEVGLISACVMDVEMTPAEWVAELAENRWTIQDRRALLSAAFEANMRVDYAVGKG